ncbi:aldose 1-epimerase [Rhizomicrobium electricum]|uniref:Aldose 1-epimerase n=1 Tax=Rhizomicrobium electricum TaxID=480070 RepID=A0ABN1EEC3_9PROT|nr:aldose 1-epimerase [Rhizomicrobium electricum]NIJ48683.1 aldose 1-epimerase [Rhizomicrobium electricum]
MITLGRGKFELDIAPDFGGAITRFEMAGKPVMRPVKPGETNVLEMCSFPLVPYANRIAGGIFDFGGRTYRLPLNFGEHPHSLHGHGWQAPWKVEVLSRDRLSLVFEHAADAWDWAYTAEQVFTMTEDGMVLALTLKNRADKPMPYSLGVHPYFPRRPGSTLKASVKGMWLADETMLPTDLVEAGRLVDLNAGQVVSKAPFVDNTFTGWQGPAIITQPELGLEIALTASDNSAFLHAFMPEGADFFCAEPTTAMPNAFNRSESPEVTGAKVLAPGAAVSLEMRIAVRAL